MAKIYVVAEAGVNHNGSLELARSLIDQAAMVGADAVKFQTFVAEEVISRFAPKAHYQQHATGSDEGQLSMVQKLRLDEIQHQDLLKYSQSQRINFLSTPFDFASVDLLVNRLKLPRIKIASGDIANAPLLMKIARTGVDIILSTGMSSLGEVETALSVLAFGFIDKDSKPTQAGFKKNYASPEGQKILQEKVILLHCTSQYPSPFEDTNLLAMDTLRQAFGLKVGLSDHTRGIAVPIAAAARGAVLIEKHLTLDRNLPGPDHQASLEPQEFFEMVNSIRQVELALGSPRKYIAGSELPNLDPVRRSLVATRNINKGEVFTEENLGIKRPGSGVAPIYYWDYLGRRADKDYQMDEAISEFFFRTSHHLQETPIDHVD